ncbi:unnamed protein product [Closterium sp. Yama58-4]|nr:unnamed protein product [Closterium sp. Yama58-4]
MERGKAGGGDGGSFGGAGIGAGIGADGMEEDGTKEEVLGGEGGGEGTEGHEGWMMDGDGCAEERGGGSAGEGSGGEKGSGGGERGEERGGGRGGGKGGKRGGAAEEVPEWAYGLEGLWTGEYGPHGVEILNVLVQGGEIVATKITGDPNVPCGQVTFKARLATAQGPPDLSDLPPTDSVLPRGPGGAAVLPTPTRSIVIPPPDNAGDGSAGRDEGSSRGDEGSEVQFVWMCQGQGRVADYNFRRPQWVNGCLLVDSAARITFLWQDVHFAIRFRRLDLPKLVHSSA